jgi:hypothetical protein
VNNIEDDDAIVSQDVESRVLSLSLGKTLLLILERHNVSLDGVP